MTTLLTWLRSNSAILALAVTLVGGPLLHQWNIGYMPLGIYSDEASIGLNASMMQQFQTDEFGHPWPVFFEAFGEYKNPVYIYAMAGLLHVAPLSDISLRGLSFLFFGLTITLWAIFALRVFSSPWTAVWTTAALAVLPWVFTLSRVSFEAVSYVSLYILLLYCIVRLFIRHKGTLLGGFLLGLLAGLCWYSYSTARLLIPLTLLSICLAYFGALRWRSWIGLGLGLALLMIPALYILFYDPQVLLGRFSTVSYIDDPSLSPLAVFWQFLQNYASYFSPDYHLWTGDTNLRHHTGFGGMAYYCVYILMWVGIARLVHGLWRRQLKRSSISTLLGLELLFAPIAASLTEPGHAIRVISMIIPLLYFCGFGLEWLYTMKSRVPYRVAILLATLMLLVEGRAFVLQSMTVYPHISVRHFMTYGIQEAVHAVGKENQTLLLVDPKLPDAAVVSNYYSLVSGNGVYVTSLPETLTESVITDPYCHLRKRKPFQPAPAGSRAGVTIPLDVRSSLSLTCYPGL